MKTEALQSAQGPLVGPLPLRTRAPRLQLRPLSRPRPLAHRKLRPGLPSTFLQRHGRSVQRVPAGVGAPPLVHTAPPPPIEPVASPPPAPVPVVAPVNALALRGEYWEVAYDGHTALIQDCRGLRYIALLIRDGQGDGPPVHAKELVALATGQPSGPIELDSDDPVLDETARAQLKMRLQEIALERRRADDEATASALDEECERIAELLRDAAAGKPGRRRGTFDHAGEKARKAVSKAISEAIARIAASPGLAPLADHLADAIRKGLWLSYAGEASWTVEFTLVRTVS